MTRLHDNIRVFQADDARCDVNEECSNSSQQIDTPGERCCFFASILTMVEKEHMKYKRNLHTHTLIDT